jgi:hypothetical protein
VVNVLVAVNVLVVVKHVLHKTGHLALTSGPLSPPQALPSVSHTGSVSGRPLHVAVVVVAVLVVVQL